MIMIRLINVVILRISIKNIESINASNIETLFSKI